MSLPHHLTNADLARLQNLIIVEHNVAEFWRVLGTEYHDTYADNAYAVIARPNTPFGEFFGTWSSSTGATPIRPKKCLSGSFCRSGITSRNQLPEYTIKI